MKHKIEIAPNLAIYIDGERVIGSKPYGMFLTTTMIVSDDDLKRLVDRCLEVIADCKTEDSSEKSNNYCDDCLYTDTCDSKEFFYACTSKATIPKMEQVDKDINVRSKDEPTTQTETQNSNLTFEKRTMRDCYNCKRYETKGECIECHYEPKQTDEPQDEYAKEYEELGLRKLKELRKDEPQTDCPWK